MVIVVRRAVAFAFVMGVAFANCLSAAPGDEPVVLKPFEGKTRSNKAYAAPVYRIAFSPDGKLLACSPLEGYDGKSRVRIYDAATRELKHELGGHDDFVDQLAFSDDSRKLASASVDVILVHDVASGKLHARAYPRPLSQYRVQFMRFLNAGKQLAVGAYWKQGDERPLKVGIDFWDFATEKTVSTIDAFGHVAISADGTLVAAANLRESKLYIWETATGRQKYAYDIPDDDGSFSVAFSPDGKIVGLDSGAWRVGFLDVQSGKLRRADERHGAYTECVVFSPDGKLLASCSDDKTVKLWNVSTAKLERTLSGHEEPVKHVAFSPDGKTLASASMDGTLRLWQVRESQ